MTDGQLFWVAYCFWLCIFAVDIIANLFTGR